MKNTILIISAIFALSCKAQTPVKSLYEDNMDIPGAYYKDSFNDLNNFVGTWKYTNGTTSLTITLQKKEMQSFDNGNIQYYEDVLIGEYKYIENGVEKISTLSSLTFNSSNWKHNIVGNVIIGPGMMYCQDCGPNERKILLAFSDPTRDIFGFEPEMIFQRNDNGGTQRLKLLFKNTGVRMKKFEETEISPYTSYTIPFGEYMLVKQ
ncbi:hypothetical protein HYN59_11070 [Flavobacterium album]|uniref:DUF6705 domain-containing protein n=1 Tax=Flavobacterium album TaxID=2175091 RepID=A0A2S1QZ00_9FLAO|nr:DUF6705 family protein [Flavobacterium album]AWH85615.1 hypothetical protein HYN59_11070 [Flavobacterium album]